MLPAYLLGILAGRILGMLLKMLLVMLLLLYGWHELLSWGCHLRRRITLRQGLKGPLPLMLIEGGLIVLELERLGLVA